MASWISSAELFRQAIKHGVVPSDAHVQPRQNEATWRENGLVFSAYLNRDIDDCIGWSAIIRDPQYGALNEAGGVNAHIALEPCVSVDHRVPWPSRRSASDEVMGYLGTTLGACPRIIDSRRTFLDVLLAPQGRRWGAVCTRLGSYPARLVQSLLIARDIGDGDLEERIRQKLTSSEPTDEYEPASSLDRAARVWANRMERTLGSKIVY